MDETNSLAISSLQKVAISPFALVQRRKKNGHVERLIGSIRRDSLDHLLVFGEAHPRDVLKNYACITTKSAILR